MCICIIMASKILFCCLIAGLLAPSVKATKYEKCGLAKILLKNGMPRDQLSNWVCLVQAASNGNTAAKEGPNTDGSYDYGLFQISNRYWCKDGSAGGECHLDCSKLLNNNITDDAKCARLIYQKQGWTAWSSWVKKCRGPLPDLSNCGV